MIRSIFFSLVGTLLVSVSFGQSKESHDASGYRVKAGFFAESLVHPGLTFGIEKNLWSKLDQRYNDKRLNPKRRKKVVLKEFYWSGSIWGYNHPNNEWMMGLSAGIGYQRSSSKGSIWGIETDLGLGRFFNTNPTYELEVTPDETKITEVPLAGSWAFTPGAMVFWGWNGWLRKNRSWSFRVGPTVYARVPYNSFGVLSAGLVGELILHNIF